MNLWTLTIGLISSNTCFAAILPVLEFIPSHHFVWSHLHRSVLRPLSH